MAVIPNPNLAAELQARHKVVMVAAAVEAASILHTNLDSSTHGTGVHWPDLPFRSSSPGQFPVKQSGALVSGVGVDDGASPTGAQVVIEDDLEKLIDLEFAPPSINPNPSPGTRESGGRAPMWTTMMDHATIEAMNDAITRS